MNYCENFSVHIIRKNTYTNYYWTLQSRKSCSNSKCKCPTKYSTAHCLANSLRLNRRREQTLSQIVAKQNSFAIWILYFYSSMWPGIQMGWTPVCHLPKKQLTPTLTMLRFVMIVPRTTSLSIQELPTHLSAMSVRTCSLWTKVEARAKSIWEKKEKHRRKFSLLFPFSLGVNWS